MTPITLSLHYAQHCVRCHRPEKGKAKSTMTITARKWFLPFAIKFRLCTQCTDEIVERAENNPNLTVTVTTRQIGRP